MHEQPTDPASEVPDADAAEQAATIGDEEDGVGFAASDDSTQDEADEGDLAEQAMPVPETDDDYPRE
jgi:hypothetical protein